MFDFIFGSPIRKALKKSLDNRIKNAEAKFNAEAKTLKEQKIHNKLCLIESFQKDLSNLNADHKAKESQIIEKCVSDVLGTSKTTNE